MVSRGTLQLITSYTKKNRGAKTQSKYSCCRCSKGYDIKNEVRLCQRCKNILDDYDHCFTCISTPMFVLFMYGYDLFNILNKRNHETFNDQTYYKDCNDYLDSNRYRLDHLNKL